MSRRPQPTLGQYLEDARQGAGLTLRQLSAATDVPKTVLIRLLHDQVQEPVPAYLVRLAEALELRTADLFLLADLPLPESLPTVEAYLRAEYDLPDEAIREAKAQIDAIADRYNPANKSRNPKGGKI